MPRFFAWLRRAQNDINKVRCKKAPLSQKKEAEGFFFEERKRSSAELPTESGEGLLFADGVQGHGGFMPNKKGVILRRAKVPDEESRRRPHRLRAILRCRDSSRRLRRAQNDISKVRCFGAEILRSDLQVRVAQE